MSEPSGEPIKATESISSKSQEKPYRIVDSVFTNPNTSLPFKGARSTIRDFTLSIDVGNSINGELELAIYDKRGKMIGQPQALRAGQDDLEEAIETYTRRVQMGESPQALLRKIQKENETAARRDVEEVRQETQQAERDEALLKKVRQTIRSSR